VSLAPSLAIKPEDKGGRCNSCSKSAGGEVCNARGSLEIRRP